MSFHGRSATVMIVLALVLGVALSFVVGEMVRQGAVLFALLATATAAAIMLLTAGQIAAARRRAEAELRRSEERFSQVFVESPVGIMVFDGRGQLTAANPASLRIFGIDALESIRDGDLFEIFELLGEQRDRVRAGEVLRCEMEVDFNSDPPGQPLTCTRAGKARLHASIGPLSTGEGGVPTGYLAQVHDVTEEVQALDDLQQARLRAEQYLDVAGVMFLAIDRDGTVSLINQHGYEVLGCGEDDILGRDWFESFLPERLRANTRRFFSEIIAGDHGEITGGENPVLRADGSERLVSWHNVLLRDADGNITGTLSSGEDVTDARRLQNQFERAERMEAVGRLAGGVAHDFNNLLSAIVGHLGMLLRGLDPDDPGRPHAEQIDVAVRQAATVTRQLLSFSRSEPVVTRSEPMDLNQVIEGLRTLVQPLLARDIHLDVQLAPDLRLVHADTGEIQQMLMNLIINARDAMSDGGSLTISTRNADVGGTWLADRVTSDAGRCVLISVADTGEGMDEDTRAHIFEPFFTTKPDGEGTGLGLSTVYRVVQNLGGAVEVSSEPGEGALFELYLPCCEEAADSSDPAVDPLDDEALRGSETVLVAEDESVLRELCRVMLEEFGYVPLVAPDGESALEIARRERGQIDMLVTDILMPGMSGVQLAERMQELIPGLPVLFVSGYAGGIVVQGERFDPGDALLHKPFTLDDMLLAMRKMLDS